jgi:hypothetical protein
VNPPKSSGYFVLGIGGVLSLIQAISQSTRNLDMVIWSLLVLGAVVVLTARE